MHPHPQRSSLRRALKARMGVSKLATVSLDAFATYHMCLRSMKADSRDGHRRWSGSRIGGASRLHRLKVAATRNCLPLEERPVTQGCKADGPWHE